MIRSTKAPQPPETAKPRRKGGYRPGAGRPKTARPFTKADRVSIDLYPEQRGFLRGLAEAHNMSMPRVIRAMVNAALYDSLNKGGRSLNPETP